MGERRQELATHAVIALRLQIPQSMQDRIVMSDDLLCLQYFIISGGVGILYERNIVTQRSRFSAGTVNAVFCFAAHDNQMIDAVRL